MSKRMMTKYKHLLLTAILVTTTAIALNTHIFDSSSIQAQLLSSCMAEQSNLPMNHINHPCHATYMSNQSWWSLLSGDSPSAHFFYLDLVELIQRSVH